MLPGVVWLQDWDAKKANILQRFVANSSIRVTPKFDVLVVGMKRTGKQKYAPSRPTPLFHII